MKVVIGLFVRLNKPRWCVIKFVNNNLLVNKLWPFAMNYKLKTLSNYFENFYLSVAGFITFRIKCSVVDSTNHGPRSDLVISDFVL